MNISIFKIQTGDMFTMELEKADILRDYLHLNLFYYYYLKYIINAIRYI